MSTPTEIQIIQYAGKPAFVVVPYQQWLAITGQGQNNTYIPHEVVALQVKEELSLIAAWRKYKGLSQKELAARIGISQPAMTQIEKKDSKSQNRTLEKIANALKININQLVD